MKKLFGMIWIRTHRDRPKLVGYGILSGGKYHEEFKRLFGQIYLELKGEQTAVAIAAIATKALSEDE